MMHAATTSGRELMGMRLPVHDPAAFTSGETITINGVSYIVQEVTLGMNRVIIAVPVAPHRGDSVFIGLLA